MAQDGHISKLLGAIYEWMRTETDESYVTMSITDQTKKIVSRHETHTGKTPKIYDNPGVPGTTLQKNEEEPIKMKDYCSLVRQVMFYSTKIAPECSF